MGSGRLGNIKKRAEKAKEKIYTRLAEVMKEKLRDWLMTPEEKCALQELSRLIKENQESVTEVRKEVGRLRYIVDRHEVALKAVKEIPL